MTYQVMIMKKMKVNVRIMAFFIITMLIVPFVNAEDLNAQFSQLQLNDSLENVNIQKGFSLIPGIDHYQIPVGSIIYYSSDGITRVFDSNGTQILIANDTNTQKIPTSAGDFFATNIIQVPSGVLIKERMNSTDVILNNQSILILVYEKNLASEYDKNLKFNNLVQLENGFTGGYVERVDYSPVFNLGSFYANWTIPSSPPSPSSSVVQDDLWTSIQPNNYGPGHQPSIAQPVTTFINNHWIGYVTYVNSYNKYFNTPNFPVYVGDTIQGQLLWDNNHHWWYVRIWDLTNSNSYSNITVDAPEITKDNLFVMCTLESHNVIGNSDLPSSTTFYDIRLNDNYGNPINFNWYTWVNSTAQMAFHVLHAYAPSQSQVILFTNGDKIGTFRNGVWSLDYNLDGIPDSGFQFGTSGDFPITGDWNGDGVTDIGVFRPSARQFILNTVPIRRITFGLNTDIPITGDWNGDGITDVGVFRPSTQQFILNTVPITRITFGLSTDIPITGDWNGDGITDVGVFRPSAQQFILNIVPITRITFGLSTDTPVTGRWV